MRFIPLKGELPPEASKEMQEYFTKADAYWEDQQRDENLTYIKLLCLERDNMGLILIRFSSDKKCHISRFFVDKKSTGLGSKIVKRLQQIFDEITLWSNPEALAFYERNGFDFHNHQKTVYNDKILYTHGDWKQK